MNHKVLYKMPRARKTAEFTVYPFSSDDTKIQLQSDNHCAIVYLEGPNKGKTVFSKRFNQYPRFEYCKVSLGGKIVDTPVEINAQITEIMEKPTGKQISLLT